MTTVSSNLRRSRCAVAMLFALLLIVGLFTSVNYGLPCDEPAEQKILQENLKEYAYRFFGPESAAVRYYDALEIDRISQSIERDHGQAAYYLAAPLLTLAQSEPALLLTLWHMYTWLWFMLGVLAVYGFCRQTGLSRVTACIGALMYYLCPRFFAEGHYNNKDMVLLSLVLLTLWLGARLLSRPGFVRGLLFSLAGAMAANTKIAGAFTWAVMSLCAIVLLTARRAWNRRMLAVAAITLGGFILLYALLTPALWDDPSGYVAYLFQNAAGFTRWSGVVVFRGAVYEHSVNPLPRYYLPYMMLTTLPLYIPPLAAAGQLSALKRAVKQKGAALRDPATLSLLAATLAWLTPLLFAVATRPLVYNGWRHFYFAYAGLAMLTSHGVQALWRFCANRRGAAWLPACAWTLSLCLCLNAVGIALNHPYQYGYYNLLAQANAEADMELDYWDVSTLNAMKRLLAVEDDMPLPLSLGARDDMSWFGVEHGYEALDAHQRQSLNISYDPNASYLFYNTTYAKIYDVAPPDGYSVLFTLESYGNTLCTVYRQNAE